jgi:hypothetical protein
MDQSIKGESPLTPVKQIKHITKRPKQKTEIIHSALNEFGQKSSPRMENTLPSGKEGQSL